MFSGKTEELIRRVRRALIAKQKVQVFKPVIDNRYSHEEVASHNGQRIKAIPLSLAKEIFDELHDDTTVVALDEVQFFDIDIISVVEKLANDGLRVIAAGLDADFRKEPFGFVPAIASRAEEVLKLHAICSVCGDEASFTQRLVDGNPAFYDDPIILVGAQESYEARCREHHLVPHREKEESDAMSVSSP